MKKYKLLFLSILSFLILTLDTIIANNFASKVLLIINIILFGILFFTKKIKQTDQKYFIFLIGYLILYFMYKISNDNINYAVNSLFIIFKFFIIPITIYNSILLLKNKKETNKELPIILLSIIFLLFTHFYKIELYNLIAFYLLMLYMVLSKNNYKKIFQNIIILLITLTAIIAKNNLLLIINIILCLITLLKEHKEVKKINKTLIIIAIVNLLCLGGLLIYVNNTETEALYKIINPEFEIKQVDNYINQTKDIVKLYKYYTLKDIVLGISYYNVNNQVFSLTHILSICGIVGTLLYIILWKKIINLLNKEKIKYVIPIMLLIFLTNLYMNPIIALPLSMIFINCISDIRNESNSKLFNKSIIIYFLATIFCSIIISLSFFDKKEVNKNYVIPIYIKDELKTTDDFKLKKIKKTSKTTKNLREDLYHYQLKNENRILAEIIYSKRLTNNVELNYITIHNASTFIEIDLNINKENLKPIKEFEKYNIDRPYSYLVGEDKLKLPIGYYTTDNNYIIVGRSIKYNTLTSVYENNNKSTIYNLLSQDIDLNNNIKEITIEPNTSVDTYIIQSENQLFKDDQSIEEFTDLLNKNSSWITYKGVNCKLQYSIDPFTKEGYGTILGRLIDENIYNKSLNDNNDIYKALNESALFSLYNYTARLNEDGIWFSNYTSTWLSKDYGTKSYYIDTRYNETLGYYLLNIYNNTKEEKHKKAFLAYANFIVNIWNSDNIYKVENSKLLPDYFSDSTENKTHSSLNHQLALINYLFKAYEITNENNYLETAEEMLDNILKFKEKWIRDNGDLWYQINGHGEFSGTDYEIVTLEDLLFTQNYLVNIKQQKDEIVEILIKSKVKYLNNNNINIPEFDKTMLKKLEILE